MWLVYALLTTLIWGIAELFYKKGALANEKYSHLKITVCVGIVMGIHAVIILCTQNINFNLLNIIKYLPVSLLYMLSMAMSYFGIRFIEESISDPIENTSGAICSILCVAFLGSEVNPLSFVAIGIILLGILGVGFLENHGDSDRRKKIGKTMAIVAFAMPFCYAILDGVGSFIDSIYLEMETTPLIDVTEDTIENVANTCYELTFLFTAICLLVFMRIKKVPFELPKQKDKIIAAVCETAGQFTYVFAMSGNGNPAISAPIISCVCVVSLLLSRIFLKEKLSWKQYIFIVLILIGIVALGIIEGE